MEILEGRMGRFWHGLGRRAERLHRAKNARWGGGLSA